MSLKAQESRVDFLVRLMGVLVLGFGAVLIYFTYTNADVLTQSAPLIPVYYLLGLILLFSGLLAAFSKFK